MIKRFIGWLAEREQKNKLLFVVIRITVVIVALFLGGLFAIGSYIAIQFERSGFGIDRPTDPFLIAVYATGFAASLIIPTILWRFLLPKWIGRWWWIGIIAGIGGAVVLLGVTM